MELEEAIRRENTSGLIAMKYSCKFCHKRFPCGRSLGGHMRSHLMTYPTNHETSYQEKVNTTTIHNNNDKQKEKLISPPTTTTTNEFSIEAGYGLREKPKKTWRATGSTEGDQDPNLLPFQGSYSNTQQSKSCCCKECGKSFHSSKALCGHMKSHSVEREKEKERLVVKQNYLLVGDRDSIESQQDMNHRQRRSSRRPGNMGFSTHSNNGSSSSVSEIDQQEQEEVAMCLILLSRDVGPWGDLSDHNSVFLESPPLTRVRFRGAEEEQESDSCKNVKSDDLDEEYTTSGYITTLLKDKCRAGFELSGVELGHNLSSKRSKNECSTCNKTFHSHQALGGHRASHKKTKGCSSGIPTPVFHQHSQAKGLDGEGSTRVVQVIQKHECPICFRVFASGQALGGHKRSHVIAQSRSEYKLTSADKSTTTTTTTTSNHKIRDILDLNQPAPVEEEASNGSDQLHQKLEVVGFKPWWVESTTKHEQLVGMN